METKEPKSKKYLSFGLDISEQLANELDALSTFELLSKKVLHERHDLKMGLGNAVLCITAYDVAAGFHGLMVDKEARRELVERKINAHQNMKMALENLSAAVLEEEKDVAREKSAERRAWVPAIVSALVALISAVISIWFATGGNGSLEKEIAELREYAFFSQQTMARTVSPYNSASVFLLGLQSQGEAKLECALDAPAKGLLLPIALVPAENLAAHLVYRCRQQDR